LAHQLHHLLPDDPVFEEAITNPIVLTLVTYLAGYRAKIATTAGLIKANDSDEALVWHCDNTSKLAMPWPNLSSGANVNWLLTDYSRENGALCVVPGSHTWCRNPDPGFSHEDEMVKIIEAPAGSIAVWHTNLWHAALPRTAPGQRVTFVTLYLRNYLQPSEPFAMTTTSEMIERNPARFSVLTGLLSVAPYGPPGPLMEAALEFSPDLGRWG
jgi:ectoine hydroxylase-related dioxygenase (phytanoyl-CoA dioxygenase family)